MNTSETGLSPEQLESAERLAQQEGGVQRKNTARIVRQMKEGKYTGDGKKESITEKPGVVADDPMSEAGRKVMAFYFDRMLSQEQGVRQGDGEDPVHDMRVATRRLRSALKMFEPYYHKRVTRPFRKTL